MTDSPRTPTGIPDATLASPGRQEAILSAVVADLNREEPKAALEKLIELERIDPTYPNLHLMSGLCLAKMKYLGDACWAIEHERYLHPDNAVAVRLLETMLIDITKGVQFGDEIALLHSLMRRQGLVIDVGSNIGDFSEFFLLRGHPVISIEPLTQNAQRQHNKFAKLIERGQMHLFKCACSDYEGESEIFISDDPNGVLSSLDEQWTKDFDWGFKQIRKEKVKVLRLVQILTSPTIPNTDIELLKIDTEGNDFAVLKGLFGYQTKFPNPRFIMSEFRCEPRNIGKTKDSVSLLKLSGYTRFKFYVKWGEETLHQSGWITAEEFLRTDLTVWSKPDWIPYGNYLATADESIC